MTELQILNDLEKLTDRQIQDKYYYSVDLSITEPIIDDFGGVRIPLSHLLSDMKIDRDLTKEYYTVYDGNNTCFDVNEFLFEYKKFEETLYGNDVINTYNYDSNLECIIQFSVAYDDKNDKYVIALEVHNGVDARAGYSDIFIYEYTGDIDYIFDMMETCYLYIGNDDNYHMLDIYGTDVIEAESGFSVTNTCDLCDHLEQLKKNGVKIEADCFEY